MPNLIQIGQKTHKLEIFTFGQFWLVGLVGRKMVVGISNSFYVVFAPLLAPIPNFIQIGQKTQKLEIFTFGRFWSPRLDRTTMSEVKDVHPLPPTGLHTCLWDSFLPKSKSSQVRILKKTIVFWHLLWNFSKSFSIFLTKRQRLATWIFYCRLKTHCLIFLIFFTRPEKNAN